jgi:ribosomal subunit interface protein
MNYTENFEGIKVDVQAVDLTISDTLQQQIRDSIVKLKRHTSQITWVDVYFKEEEQHNTNNKTVGMRLGVPGPDVYATDSGNAWMPLLKSVEEKLSKQLQKQ